MRQSGRRTGHEAPCPPPPTFTGARVSEARVFGLCVCIFVLTRFVCLCDCVFVLKTIGVREETWRAAKGWAAREGVSLAEVLARAVQGLVSPDPLRGGAGAAQRDGGGDGAGERGRGQWGVAEQREMASASRGAVDDAGSAGEAGHDRTDPVVRAAAQGVKALLDAGVLMTGADLLTARERNQRRMARQNYLRTHPDEESQDPSDEEVGF